MKVLEERAGEDSENVGVWTHDLPYCLLCLEFPSPTHALPFALVTRAILHAIQKLAREPQVS